MQERRKSIANALELHLSCTNPSKKWSHIEKVPDSMVYGANMGPIWGWQDYGGPHVGPMNFAIWGDNAFSSMHKLVGLMCPSHCESL